MQQRNGCLVLVMVAVMACSDRQEPEARPHVQDSPLVDTIGTPDSVRVEAVVLDTTPVKLIPADITLAKGLHFKLRIPDGYELKVAAEGMTRLRFLCPSPDGRMFATDMHDLTDNTQGRVYIFDQWDEGSARYATRHVYLSGLRNPNQVAFYLTPKDTSLYVATTEKLLRYQFHRGDTVPSGPPAIIDTFPSYGLSYKYGGWHLTRSIAFHNNKLYVSIGSSCNACIETEEMRATIVEMDPDGSNRRIYASGLRNAVGIKWSGDQLFATDMGSDQFGTEAPEDKLQRITDGGYYGWPYYYQCGDSVILDTVFAKRNMRLRGCSPAYAALGPHTAAIGLDLFSGYDDARLNGWFVVALHGSSVVRMGKGYRIVRVQEGHAAETIVDGFLQGKDRVGRPCDVRMRDATSFWFTDDLNGVLYLLRRKR